MAILVLLAVLLALAAVGLLFGEDSRDGRDWQPGFWGPGTFHA